MKPSRFNRFVPTPDGKTLAFNSFTASLAEIDSESLPIVRKLLANSQPPSGEKEHEIHGALCQGKYLIDDVTDELALLTLQNRRQRFSRDSFVLTIAPTMACNFACDYCFERHTASHMNEDTEQALVRFVEKEIIRSKDMHVTWFGGEPTLCLDMIERLQSAFTKLIVRHNLTMQPGFIITNGYLLNAANSRRLASAGVTRAQVTLDGPPEIHDARRKLKNGKGSFGRIIENLKEAADILHILIRVNVDRVNLASAREVVRILRDEQLLSKVAIVFSPVTGGDQVCADVHGRCFSTSEFARGQSELYRRLLEDDFTQIEYPSLASGGHCGADSDHAYVVAPNGLLFKCWEDLSTDNSKSVGSIFTEEVTPRQQKNLAAYLSWDPLALPGCRDCNILPVCMGGCPLQAVKQNDASHGACCSWKYNLEDMLVLRYLCERRKETKSRQSAAGHKVET